jgi:hypothetical protein
MPGIVIAIAIAVIGAITVCAGAMPPQISIVTRPPETTGMNPAGTRIFITSAQANTHAAS